MDHGISGPIVQTTTTISRNALKSILDPIFNNTIFFSSIYDFPIIVEILDYVECTSEEQLHETFPFSKTVYITPKYYGGEKCSICNNLDDNPFAVMEKTSIFHEEDMKFLPESNQRFGVAVSLYQESWQYFCCSKPSCLDCEECFAEYWQLQHFRILSMMLPIWKKNRIVLFPADPYFTEVKQAKEEDISICWKWSRSLNTALCIFKWTRSDEKCAYFIKMEDFWILNPDLEDTWWEFYGKIFYLYNQYYFETPYFEDRNQDLHNYFGGLGQIMQKKYPSFELISTPSDYKKYIQKKQLTKNAPNQLLENKNQHQESKTAERIQEKRKREKDKEGKKKRKLGIKGEK